MKAFIPNHASRQPRRGLLCASLCVLSVLALALPLRAQTLTHRYSFTTDASDLVGGANGTLEGSATVSAGQVQLDGGSGWVLLPPGLLDGYTAITVETWLTWDGPGVAGQGGGYQRVFDFGNNEQPPGTPGSQQYDSVTLVANDGNNELSFWDVNTAWYGSDEEQVVGFLSSNVQHQVVWTYDGVKSVVYVDGAALSSKSPLDVPYKFLNGTNIWFGQSLSSADGHFWGSMNEIRIYNGALSAVQVALDAAAGPDTLAGSNPGSLLSIAITVDPSDTFLTTKANYTSANNLNVTAQAAYSVSDPTVLFVDPLGNISPFKAGSCTITATYGGLTNSQLVTVTAPPAPVLTHRYSFATTGTNDSIGTNNGILFGDAAISGGALQLQDGGGDMHLGPGLFDASYQSVSVEFWGNFAPTTAFGEVFWAFGNTDGNNCYIRAKSGAGNMWMVAGPSTPLKPGPMTGNIHVVGIWDPVGNQLSAYLNGRLFIFSPFAGGNFSDSVGPNNVDNVIGGNIGDSQLMNGASVTEFRTYNGALSPIQIRTSLAAGPDHPTINAGPILSLSVTTRTNFIVGTFLDPEVKVSSATVSNIDLTALQQGKDQSPFQAVTFSSSDPTIVAVTPSGQIRAVAVGSATLTASFQGVSNHCTVATTEPQPLLLTHRYSFVSDGSDSISGADGVAMGGASISNGLDLTGNNASRGPYFEMPRDTVQGYTSMSVEMWVTENPTGAWSRLWSFGDWNSGGGDASGILLFNTYGGTQGLDLNCNPNVALDTVFGYDNMPIGDDYAPTNGALAHVVAVVDAVNHLGAIYTNGLLGRMETFAHNVSEINMQFVTFGKSLSSGDAYMDGIISEARIYYGALSKNQIAASFAAGPKTVGVLSGPAHVTDQPSSLTRFVGQSATFSVGAIGTPTLTYQWKQGGTAIPGATSAFYTIPSVNFSNAGSYTVTVNNGTPDTSLPAQLIVLAIPTSANLTNGLVMHLAFDGSYADTSGNGNNATNVGSPVFVPGKIGAQALEVNSDSNTNIFNAALVPAPLRYTSGGSPATLNFDAVTSWSVSFWVKYSGYPHDLPMVGNATNSTGNPGWVLTDSDGRPEIYMVDNNTPGNVVSSSDFPNYFVPTVPPTDDNQWHHMTMTIDRANQVLTYYLDGVLAESIGIGALGDISDSGAALGIGQDPSGAYAGFQGAFPHPTYIIDDVGLWSRALSAAEAESIYYAGQAGQSFTGTSGGELLSLVKSGGVWQILWQSGTLQSAPTVTGPWAAVTGATAPSYTLTIGAGNQFFRVKL